MMRDDIGSFRHFDNFNGAVAFGYIGAILAGWSINEWAALAALSYSLLLIAQKIWQFVRWLRHKPPALP